MMIMERLELASAVFWSLGTAFLDSITGGNSVWEVHPVDHCSQSLTLPGQSNATTFFLDFTAGHGCAGVDWIVMFWLFLIVHAVNWWPRWLVYEPVGNFLRGSHSGWMSKKSEKFSQALASAFSHGAMAYLAWMILKDKDWLWNIQSWAGNFHHLPLQHYHVHHQDDQQPPTTATMVVALVEPELKLYYLLYAARYFSDAVSLFYEHHRSDVSATVIHHIVTIFLILVSAQVGCTRMGGVIMFFFDWADPPLNVGKAILYLSIHKKDGFQSAANVCMGLFVVTFVLTRNVIFSYIVFHIVNLPDQDFSPTADPTVIYGIKGMLLVLVALMTFWLRMLINVVYHQFVVNGGSVDDLREQPKHIGQSYSTPGRSTNGIANQHQHYNKKQE